jgi:hypothetical protein
LRDEAAFDGLSTRHDGGSDDGSLADSRTIQIGDHALDIVAPEGAYVQGAEDGQHVLGQAPPVMTLGGMNSSRFSLGLAMVEPVTSVGGG